MPRPAVGSRHVGPVACSCGVAYRRVRGHGGCGTVEHRPAQRLPSPPRRWFGRRAPRRPGRRRSVVLCGGSGHRSAGVHARCDRFRRSRGEASAGRSHAEDHPSERRQASGAGALWPSIAGSCPSERAGAQVSTPWAQAPYVRRRRCEVARHGRNRSSPSHLRSRLPGIELASQFYPSTAARVCGAASVSFTWTPRPFGTGKPVLLGPRKPRRGRSAGAGSPGDRSVTAVLPPACLRIAPEGAGRAGCRPGGTINPG